MKRLTAYATYLLISGSSSLFFTVAFTTSAIYRFQSADLNPLQLVLVGTALETSVFLFEVPTGIVADLWSRRLSVIIGYAMIGVGLIVEGSFPFFLAILLAQVIWGTGYTFTSGALDAWLADELGEARLTKVYLRGSQVAQASSFVGIFVAVWLASIQLGLPFLIGGGGLALLALILFLFMPETGFKPVDNEDRNSWQSMGKMFGDGLGTIRKRPILITIISITFFYGLYSEALDRLWEAHFLENFTLPQLGDMNMVVWFGLINAGTMIATIVTTELVNRRVDNLTQRMAVRLLFLQNALLIIGLVLFGLASNFGMALLAYASVAVMRRTGAPIYSAWINRDIEPRVRATVLSTVNQMDAVGQVVGGPIVGSIATRFGLRTAMVAAGAILSPVLALYARASSQEKIAGLTVGPMASIGDD